MQTLNLARAKRVFRKADPFEDTVNSQEVSVAAVWAQLEFINAVRADINKVAELEAVDFPALIGACSNNARRYVLLMLINRTADQNAVEFVAEQLNCGHPKLSRSAANCLEAIGNTPARDALEAFCRDPGDEFDELTLEYARKSLSTFRYDAIPSHVFEQLEESPAIALKALANIPTRQATDILLKYLPSKDNACRLAALDGLRTRSEAVILAPVIDYVLHGTARARLDALQLLSDFTSDEALRTVCAVARNGRSIAIRKDAALALGKMQNDTAIECLMDCLQDENENANVVAAACIGLKKMDCTDAIAALTRLVQDQTFGKAEIKMLTSTNLYSLATEMLHSLCSKDTIEPFAEFLDHDVLYVRLAAIHALRQRKCTEAFQALAARLESENDRDCLAELNKSVNALRKFAPVK